MIRKITFAAILTFLVGCEATTKPKVKYGFETSTPDVWGTNPKQSVTVKVEISQ